MPAAPDVSLVAERPGAPAEERRLWRLVADGASTVDIATTLHAGLGKEAGGLRRQAIGCVRSALRGASTGQLPGHVIDTHR